MLDKRRETMGVPRAYERLQSRHANFMQAVENLGEAARKDGPLDEKTSHLIQLAAAAANRSEGAVHSHTRRALAAGATPEELRHAVILLASTIGFPAMVATSCWVDEAIEAWNAGEQRAVAKG
jgi:AhpD family alkylhydroperoxidase